MVCIHCAHSLERDTARPAFDPWLGRLWRVCPQCGRWNVVPLEDRWETLEALERGVRDAGASLLRTEHLDLVRVAGREVIRVGRPPRPELARWRYGDTLPPPPPRGLRERLRRMIAGLPSAPHGYDTSEIGTLSYPFETTTWFASPFIEHAPALTALFGHIPLAPVCPSCGQPVWVAPSAFQHVRLMRDGDRPAVTAPCAACRREPVIPLAAARPALRLALFVVNRPLRTDAAVEPAAAALDRVDGPPGLLRRLATRATAVGEAGPATRLALQMALDEWAESELLEAEWRDAEEIAGIVDGELTAVPGLEALKKKRS